MSMRPSTRTLALLLSALVLSGTAAAYTGSVLSRGPVDEFTLTDQHGDAFSFGSDADGVVVVSFMFTRCPDVCPIITLLLTAVEDELTDRERQDVTFVSITVDPEHDTPATLLEYTERMGASWPHLTGNLTELEPIWAMFGVVVQQNVIDVHVMDYQPGEASVTIVNTSNVSAHHMFDWSGWTAVQILAEEAGWGLNVSTNDTTSILNAINGVEAPANNSWTWEMNVWNTDDQAWVKHQTGVESLDALETPHLAWMPSNGNQSSLPTPDENLDASMSVLWPNGSVDQQAVEEFNAYHLTRGALEAANVNLTVEDTEYGHYMTAMDDEVAPEDAGWFWNLYSWNNLNDGRRPTSAWMTTLNRATSPGRPPSSTSQPFRPQTLRLPAMKARVTVTDGRWAAALRNIACAMKDTRGARTIRSAACPKPPRITTSVTQPSRTF